MMRKFGKAQKTQLISKLLFACLGKEEFSYYLEPEAELLSLSYPDGFPLNTFLEWIIVAKEEHHVFFRLIQFRCDDCSNGLDVSSYQC